jgi:acyl carrier protein
LSPNQELFLSMSQSRSGSGVDLWRGTISGALAPAAFRAAWNAVINRHALLRCAIHQQDPQPLIVVSTEVDLPWQELDYSNLTAEEAERTWLDHLKSHALSARNLEKAPLTRFVLAKFSDVSWKFCWMVPDLLLDGWSWPVVFGEVSRSYRATVAGETALELPHAPSYARYIKWLKEQDQESGREFWKSELAGFTRPTPVPLANATQGRLSRFGNHALMLPEDFTAAITAAARKHHASQAAIVQAAWAVLLSRVAATADVVIGVASNGRPTEIDGVESIVGPFTVNLPLRYAADSQKTAANLWREGQEKLQRIQCIPHTSLMAIQEVSPVPWRCRLFDSLVVFQNYLVDDDVLNLGDQLLVKELDGPLHTNFPIMLVVNPGEVLKLTLILPESAQSAATAQQLLRELRRILLRMVESPEVSVAELHQDSFLVAGSACAAEETPRVGFRKLPETVMEERICTLWQRAFGFDSVGTDENFFDLGGHSLLMLRVHQQICQDLGFSIPVVKLFQYPTVAALAAFLDPKSPSLHASSAGITEFGSLQPVAPAKVSIAAAARQRALAARAALRKL